MMSEVNQEVVDATKEMLKYIRLHLQETITASNIAKAGGYSQYHATRVFKEKMGLSPFEYIRRERLVQSALRLRNGKSKVLDVALDFVFDSHEGFTRAFSNAFGITPKKFAKFPVPEGWLIPYHYLNRSKTELEESNMSNQTAVIFTQIVERPARKLILKRSRNATDYFAYCEEVGCGKHNNSTPWDILCEIKEAIYEPVGLWLPESMCPAGTGVYAHGVEVPVSYTGEMPKGFDVIDLEPCKLLVFQGEPYNDEDFQTAVGICMHRIDSFNPEVYGYEYDDEAAPKMQLSPQGWRGYIEMRAVKSKS